MGYPDFEKPFIVHCDASEIGLGGVLYQQQKEEPKQPLTVIAYASRTLKPAEKNYHLHSGKLEFLALKWALCDRFDAYLYYSKPFTVFTDNNPLCYIQSTAKLNAFGMRWLNSLTLFDFRIRYRPGKVSVDCDYLSRHPEFHKYTEQVDGNELQAMKTEHEESACLVLTVKELFVQSTPCKRASKEELQLMQMQDEVTGLVYHHVKEKEKPKFEQLKSLKRKQKQLFRSFDDLFIDCGILKRKLTIGDQIVLPSCYHQLVFTQLHKNLGHLGTAKVYELAKSRFYWPGMQGDIENFITKQCSCVMDKRPRRTQRAPLQPIISSSPFEMVCIDFLHLDKCKGNYEYVLVVTDHFTRFAQAYATKNKSASAAAEAIFNNYIMYFGFPEKIHHDQGKEFNNKLWKRLHELSGIAPSNTTPYHPMGNGQCERMNQTLINMLKTLETEKKANWKDHLKSLMFAYNSMPCVSTGYSPHFLMFGRESRLPIDDMFGVKNENHQFVKKWKAALDDAIKIAKKKGEEAKEKYQKKVYGAKLTVGDKVLVKNTRPKGTGKLESFWEQNIYTIVHSSKNAPVFVVRTEDGKERKLHRNLLMKCDLVPDKKNEKPSTKSRQRSESPSPLDKEEANESSESSEDENLELFREFFRQKMMTKKQRYQQLISTPADDKTSQDESRPTFDDEVSMNDNQEEEEEEQSQVRKSKRLKRAPRRLTYDKNFQQSS